ncbi:TPA: hypothetical protein ACYSBI_001086 [Morganella morganii]
MGNDITNNDDKLNNALISIIDSDDELDAQMKKAFIDGIKELGWKAIENFPLVGGFVDSIKGAVGFASARHHLKNKMKLFKYFSGIKKYDDDIHKYISDENISFLIEKLLRDDETNKVIRYVKFTINSIKNEVKNKNSYLRILSSLTIEQIELMRRYYIAKYFDLAGFRNGYERETNIHGEDEFFSYNRSVLESYGLIDSSSTFQSKSIVCDLLTKMCHLIFDEDELLPYLIGLKEKSKIDIVIDNSHVISRFYEDKILEKLKGKFTAIKINDSEALNYRGRYYICGRLVTNEKGIVCSIEISLHEGILFKDINLIDDDKVYRDEIIYSLKIPAVYRNEESSISELDKNIDIFLNSIQSTLLK